MKNWILLIMGMLFSFTVYSQIVKEETNSIKLKVGFRYETTNIVGVNGLIVTSKNQETKDDYREWNFEKILNNLNSDQIVKVMLDEDLELKRTFINDDILHYAFLDKKNNFALISIDASSMVITKVFAVLPKSLEIKEMVILNDFIYITGELNKKPYASSINWNTGALKILPITFENNKKSDIHKIGIQVLEKSDEIFIFVNTKLKGNKIGSYAFQFSSNGILKNTINLTPKMEQYLIDINVSKVSNEKLIFTGTFSSGKAKCSKGIFFCQTNNHQVDFIKYYYYDQFKDFIKFLSKDDIEKLEEQKNDDEDFLKETRLNYSLKLNELIPYNDEYIFIGELFYPSYKKTSYSYTNDTGSHERIVYLFDGYKFSHGIVCKFGDQGEIIWSQSFKMNKKITSNDIEKNIYVNKEDPKELKLDFAHETNIKTISIDQNGEILFEHLSDNIKLFGEMNNMEFSNTNISYWYDHFFIGYGKIKLIDKNDDEIFQEVLYLNKIEYDHFKVIKNSNKAE